jgi:hypothetical protein
MSWRSWPSEIIASPGRFDSGIRSGKEEALVRSGDRIALGPLFHQDSLDTLLILEVSDSRVLVRTARRMFYASPADTVPVDTTGIHLESHSKDAGGSLDLKLLK